MQAAGDAGVDGFARSRAGDDQRVGQAAFERVAGGVFERFGTQRRGVFDVNVGEDFHVGAQALSFAQGFMSFALNQSLVGQHGSAVHVDPDEGAFAGRAKSERGAGVVAQDVEAEGDFDRLSQGVSGAGHGGDRLGPHGAFGEGRVAEVLDDDGVRSALLVGLCVGEGRVDERLHVARPSRGAGKRLEVNDAYQDLAIGNGVERHDGLSVRVDS